MDTVLFFGFAGAYTALLIWAVALATRHGWATPANLPLLVLAGLVYDNLIIASGRYIGEGPLLEALSHGRFWLHAFLTPLLVIWSWHAVRRAGVRWAARRWAALAAVLITAALIAFELITVTANLHLAARVEYGVLSYSDSAPPPGPPPMVLVVAAALIFAGFVLWRRQRWIWLLVGAVLMAVGSGVPLPLESGAVTNLFELVLLVSVLATKAWQDAAELRGPTA
ncbi:MAG: hypothetical protein M0026_14500 [Nocardiopsaceae bacterium]|nr:hypothetical protein [Nocardiopsaceae bacterium]